MQIFILEGKQFLTNTKVVKPILIESIFSYKTVFKMNPLSSKLFSLDFFLNLIVYLQIHSSSLLVYSIIEFIAKTLLFL